MTALTEVTPARPFLGDAMKTHLLYRRIFGDLPFVADGVAAGDRARAADVMAIFEPYAAQFVNRSEVAETMLWPVLVEREPASAPVVERVHAARLEVLARFDSVRVAAKSWCDDAAERDRRAVSAALTAVTDVMMPLFDDEVAALLPVIERQLSRPEWQTLMRATRASRTAGDFVVQMGWIIDGLDAGERADFLRSLQPGQRMRWHLGGRRRWQRQRDRLYDLG